MAGLAPSESVRASLAASIESEYQAKITALTAEYEAKMNDLRATYPREVARKLADALLRVGSGNVADMLTRVGVGVGVGVSTGNGSGASSNGAKTQAGPAAVAASTAIATPAPTPTPTPTPTAASPTPTPTPTAVLDIEPWIDSDRCTTCNECINLNAKMFAYNADKQATIRDPDAGTFAQLVTAAERCPVGIIHPGTPRNPREKDLAKWVKRAEPFS
jgi:pyruvate-ferredoxin/flavodoxin oxidoreductase